jgi:hypothetical protein
MIPKFIESLSGKLAERWVTNVLTPAFAFWLGGFFLWDLQLGWQKLGWQEPPVDWFRDLASYEQLALIIVGLSIILVSGNLVQRFDLAVLRLLQGYWGLFFKPLTERLKRYHYQRRLRLRNRFGILSQKPIHTLKPEQREAFLKLDWQLAQIPLQANLTMATPLGNLLRSAEQKPYDRYGLDTVICWPSLWLLLPEHARKELETARDNLNTMVRLWFWCILFIVWSPWALWIIPAALFAAGFVYYQWIIPAAAIYADLLVAAFTLYRTELYKALRWPLPKTPAEEKALGLQITEYLWRGSDYIEPEFVSPSSK